MNEEKKRGVFNHLLQMRWNRLALGFILVVLAFVFLPISTPQDPRPAKARQTATGLRTALMNYYTEYKHFPQLQDEKVDTKVMTDGSSGLITALLAVPDADATEKLNRRRILFFSTKKARSKNSFGLYFDGSSYRLNDPWGNPFVVVYDSNYDNKIEVPNSDGNGTQEIHVPVAVWSYGPNGVPGKGEGRRNDDIYAY